MAREQPTCEKPSATPVSPWIGLRYPIVASAIAAVLFTLYFFPRPETSAVTGWLRAYLAAYAHLVGAAISLFEPAVHVEGALIRGPRFAMKMVRTCDAMEVNILLVSAVAAFPMPALRRLFMVGAGLATLLAANVLRLGVLYWFGANRPGWFPRMHETVAPLFLVTIALLVFVVAIRQRRVDRASSTASATSS